MSMLNSNDKKKSNNLSNKEFEEKLKKQVKDVQLIFSEYKKENKKEQNKEER